jgi:putative transposase
MRGARYAEEQIVGVLKEREAGVETAELYEKYGRSEEMPCRWKTKYCEREVSEAQQLGWPNSWSLADRLLSPPEPEQVTLSPATFAKVSVRSNVKTLDTSKSRKGCKSESLPYIGVNFH